MDQAAELAKLQVQIADERFLTKAPPSAVQKVRDRIAKLQRECLFIEEYEDEDKKIWWKIVVDGKEHTTPAWRFYEGEWGYLWGFEGGEKNELVCCLPDMETGLLSGVSLMYYFKTKEDLIRAWIRVNEYWTTHDYF